MVGLIFELAPQRVSKGYAPRTLPMLRPFIKASEFLEKSRRCVRVGED